MDQVTIKKRVVGVDIRLEETTFAIVDARGNIIARDSFPTEDYTEIGAYVSKLSEEIVKLIDANGGYDTIRSVGISCPSSNYRTGSIENSPNMPWKGSVPLAALLRDRLGLAVALANNNHVIALAEQSFGNAHGMRDFVVVNVGSGVGSCIVSNGLVHLGAEGFAGEIGHVCLIPDGRECRCGNKGCVEAYCSVRGLLQTAHEVLEEFDEPSKMRQPLRLTAHAVIEFCNHGDALAQEAVRRTGRYLGMALANYASVLNPEAFFFTGSVSKAGKWLLEPAYEAFNSHVFHNIEKRVQFLPSGIEDSERVVLGASVLAWSVKEYSLFKE